MLQSLNARLALIAAAAACLAACTTPDGAATQAAAPSGRITPAMEGQLAADGSPIRCRSVQVTGSRFPVRECKSELVWKEYDTMMAENAKSATDGFQRVRTGCSTSGEGGC